MKSITAYIKLLLFVLCCTIAIDAAAQQNFYKYRLGVSGGMMNYWGDLTDDYPQIKNYMQLGYGAHLERSYGKTLGLRLAYNKGTITYNDRTLGWNDEFLTDSENFDRSLNFETKLHDASATLVFYPDNDKLLSDRAFISPYFLAGFGFTWFDVYGDLEDENGDAYNYSFPGEIDQDGEFETDLREANIEGASYDRRAMHVPVGLGLKFRLSDRWNFNLETTAKYALTDYLDDVSERGNSDKWNRDVYIYSNASLNYNFGLKKRTFKTNPIIADEFARLNYADSLGYNIGGAADAAAAKAAAEATAEDDIVSARKMRKLAKKQARADRKSAKEAEKIALANCLATCEGLEKKKDRKACKKACKKDGEYIAPQNGAAKVEEENKGVESPIDEMLEEQEAREAALDSLQQVMNKEAEIRRETGEVPATPIVDDTPGQSLAPTYMPAPTPVYAPTAAPASGPSAGETQNSMRSQSNEREIQDLKMQLELMKVRQELGVGNTPATSPAPVMESGDAATDARIEMYQMEIDRLRQEASDNKIMGKLEVIEKQLDLMNQGGGKEVIIEKEIIIEGGNETEVQKEVILQKGKGGESVKEVIIEKEGASNEEIERLNKRMEELQELIKELEQGNAGDSNDVKKKQ